MEINLTLIGQMITFAIFVWVTMKYIWPPILNAINDRQARIAEGLAAGDRGRKELELAEHRAVKILQEAKLEASHIMEKANKRAVETIEQAKDQARNEGAKIIQLAHTKVEQMEIAAKETLRTDVIKLSLKGAEKILKTSVDEKVHDNMLKQLAEEL